jgi:AcrR family transcriptional regulator
VSNNHRERLIAAMAASVEERGYRETTVADVVRIARTSRRTFYEHFHDRADCFLALFRTTNDQVMAAIAASTNASAPWEEQVDQALGAYLDAVVSRPALYQAFVRELPALGERGAELQLAGIELFARQMVELVERARRARPGLDAGPLGLDEAIMVVGGVRELMVIAAQQGRDVRELRPAMAAVVNAIVRSAVVGSEPVHG